MDALCQRAQVLTSHCACVANACSAETDDEESSESSFAMSNGPAAVSKGEDASIRQGLVKNDIFASLTTDQVDFLVKGFKMMNFEAGEVVIKQGEKGDHFYIVSSGEFEATLAQENAKVVATYRGGDSFGELALLYNSPRAATVTCTQRGKAWVLERKRFRRVMVQTASAALGQRTEIFLKSVPILSGLTDAQRATLADQMEELTCSDGEHVMRQGDVADALYFVKRGQLMCWQGTDSVHEGKAGGEEKVRRSSTDSGVVEVNQGEVLGESCLEPTVNDAVRKANVVAVGEVVLLRLTANAFKRHVGVLADVIQENFKTKVMDSVEIDGIRFFRELSKEAYGAVLREMREAAFEPNAHVIRQYQTHSTFYVIKSGSATAVQSPDRRHNALTAPNVLATLHSGEFFGERALLTSDVANCDVFAGAEGLKAYAVSHDAFRRTSGGTLEALLAKVVRIREETAATPPPPAFRDLDVRRILGVGTFGRVKLVVHKPSKRPYALKCMRKAQVVEMKQLAAVVREKTVLAQMRHPFILKLVATYQDAGELYILMELALGGELFTLLQKRGALFEKQAIFYVGSVVSTFAYMHSLGCVYRDLKPENLLLDEKGYLKLVDFGFGKDISRDGKTYTLCGTPEYLAPEVILNKGHGFGADWWCVGIFAFECMTGTTPFVTNDTMEQYRKIIKGVVPWPSRSMIGDGPKAFISALLQTNPVDRLGCFREGGQGVKDHEWFPSNRLDFAKLEAFQLPAPFLPKVKSAVDTSNFDQYDQDEGLLDYPEADFPPDMFTEFADVWV